MFQDVVAQLDPTEQGAEKRGSILIVDDDQDQVDVLAHRLKKQGFSTVLAHQGRVGLEKARQHRPDVVLLDLRLPDLDGFAVCEQLVDAPETCHIPVIIVSGVDQDNIVRSSRTAGCEFFVRKPYDPNVLLTLIQHAMQRSRGWDF
ncbi:MAG: response regulator [Planctomycetota bacterium]